MLQARQRICSGDSLRRRRLTEKLAGFTADCFIYLTALFTAFCLSGSAKPRDICPEILSGSPPTSCLSAKCSLSSWFLLPLYLRLGAQFLQEIYPRCLTQFLILEQCFLSCIKRTEKHQNTSCAHQSEGCVFEGRLFDKWKWSALKISAENRTSKTCFSRTPLECVRIAGLGDTSYPTPRSKPQASTLPKRGVTIQQNTSKDNKSISVFSNTREMLPATKSGFTGWTVGSSNNSATFWF